VLLLIASVLPETRGDELGLGRQFDAMDRQGKEGKMLDAARPGSHSHAAEATTTRFNETIIDAARA
jgi:hypothetical protein